jgi:hypothetical protein
LTNLALILSTFYPNDEWTLAGDSYKGLSWLSSTVKPSEAELVDSASSAEDERLEAEAAGLAAKESAYEKLSGWGLTPGEIAAIIPV